MAAAKGAKRRAHVQGRTGMGRMGRQMADGKWQVAADVHFSIKWNLRGMAVRAALNSAEFSSHGRGICAQSTPWFGSAQLSIIRCGG